MQSGQEFAIGLFRVATFYTVLILNYPRPPERFHCKICDAFIVTEHNNMYKAEQGRIITIENQLPAFSIWYNMVQYDSMF